jgi:hypothetical protein
LKTPLSQIVLILQALNEGLGVNAVCRLFRVSKNSLYRWQERLSDLKPTLLLYALCHQFLNLMVEGDELYTKVKKTSPRGRSRVDHRTAGAGVSLYLGAPLWTQGSQAFQAGDTDAGQDDQHHRGPGIDYRW